MIKLNKKRFQDGIRHSAKEMNYFATVWDNYVEDGILTEGHLTEKVSPELQPLCVIENRENH